MRKIKPEGTETLVIWKVFTPNNGLWGAFPQESYPTKDVAAVPRGKGWRIERVEQLITYHDTTTSISML